MSNDLGWQSLSVASLIEAGVLEIGDGYRAKNSEMGNRGLPFLRIANVTNGGIDLANADLLAEANLGKVGSKISRSGDVVFTTKGSVGRFAYVKPDTPQFVYSPQVSYWRVLEDGILISRFLLYWLQGPEFTKQVYQVKGLTDMADYVNLRDQRKMTIRAPSVPTQRKIADILSAYDDLIENNTRRIQILEEMAQTIYREWFVHFRFPGHENVEMVDTELGLVPAGWKWVTLDQIAEVNARSLRVGELPDTVQYVDISSVSTGQIDNVREMPSSEAPGRARRSVRHGDTIWSCVRPNRRSYSLILYPDENVIASTGFAVLSPVDIPFPYLYQAVTTDDFVAYLTNHARGAAYPAVTSEDFKEAVVLMPDSSRLHRYSTIAEPLVRLKHSLVSRNHVLRQSRDLLIPKLLSGEINICGLIEQIN